MPDYPFNNSNESPKYTIVDLLGRFFFSPAIQDRDARADLFHGHHIVPNNLFDDADFADFWQKLGARYSQSDPLINQAWLPSSLEDALRLGTGVHTTNHSEYDLFIRRKLTEIHDRAQSAVNDGMSESDAYDRAAKDIHGLQQWVKWALQEVDANGRPLLVIDGNDPRLNGFTAAQINDSAHINFKIYVLSGSDYVDGSLKADLFFQMGFNGVEPGNYGHMLDFAADGAHWDTDARAEVIARDIAVSHLKAMSGGSIDVTDIAEFRQMWGTDAFASIKAATKAQLDTLNPAELSRIVNAEALGSKLLQDNPNGFLKWYVQVHKDISSLDVDLFGNLAAELQSGVLAVLDRVKSFIVDQSGAVQVPDLSDIDPATALKIGLMLSAAAFGVFKTHLAYEKHGGFTPAFWDWAKGEAAGFAIGLPVAGAAMFMAASSPVGFAVVISAGTAFGYFELKEIAQDVAQSSAYQGTAVADLANTIMVRMNEFEAVIKVMGSMTLAAVEKLIDTVPTIQYIAGDGAAMVVEANQWLLGNERATLVGSSNNDFLVHLGSGEALGRGGDDTIVAIGSDYNDPFDKLELRGGDGADWLMSFGGDGSFMYGGAGEDWLVGWGAEDHLWGGDGSGADDGAADVFNVTWGTFVEDAQATDYVSFGPVRLTGGVQQGWMEGGYAYWAPFTSLLGPLAITSPAGALFAAIGFTIEIGIGQLVRYRMAKDAEGDTQLQIEFARGALGYAVIENYNIDLEAGTADGNLFVFRVDWVEATDAALENYKTFFNLALKAAFGMCLSGTDPLVIDLDGDGIELTRLEAGTRFDIDNDGFAEQTAWVAGDDGMLARDLNVDNVINTVGARLVRHKQCNGNTPAATLLLAT